MARLTDQNELRLIGANPYMVVHEDPEGPPTTHVSWWRVEVSPEGPGNVLFFYSELTGGEPRIYSDHTALARWIQSELVNKAQPYKDPAVPVIEAKFSSTGSVPGPVSLEVEAPDVVFHATWSDFLPPFSGGTTPEEGDTHGHIACYVPAQKIRVTLNGVEAKGGPLARERDGYESSSCFLALNESWTRVRK